MIPPFYKSKRAGFTLIETLVAITILMVAIVGPLFAANQALSVSLTARDRFTASYLAQEGIEYVRMMRDNAFLENRGSPTVSTVAWNEFLASAISVNSISYCIGAASLVCELDPANTPAPLFPCDSGAGCTPTPLYLNNGLYQQGMTGTKSLFTRTLSFTSVDAVDEKVTVLVTWSEHGQPYSVSYSDTLMPWQ